MVQDNFFYGAPKKEQYTKNIAVRHAPTQRKDLKGLQDVIILFLQNAEPGPMRKSPRAYCPETTAHAARQPLCTMPALRLKAGVWREQALIPGPTLY